jgi:hypothetical protein
MKFKFCGVIAARTDSPMVDYCKLRASASCRRYVAQALVVALILGNIFCSLELRGAYKTSPSTFDARYTIYQVI